MGNAKRVAVMITAVAAIGISTSAAAAPPHPLQGSRTASVSASSTTAVAPRATGQFRTAPALPSTPVGVTGKGGALLVRTIDTTQASAVAISLSVSSIERYWYWASGVKVSANGLKPGEPVRITDTSPSGAVFTFDPATAGANGTVSATLKALDFSSEIGTHLITVTGTSSGLSGTARLTVLSDPDKTLRVSTSPTSLTQDQFFAKPVSIRAEGLKPGEPVFFNLFMPDGVGMAVAPQQGLHADQYGVFTYTLQAANVNQVPGLWTVSIIGQNSGQSGSGQFLLTPGAARQQVGGVRLAPTRTTLDSFVSPGESFTVSGMPPFSAVDLTLTTPLGYVAALGTARVNGDGTYTTLIQAPSGSPLGAYVLRATSQTTGNYAEGIMLVTDPRGGFPAPPVFNGPPEVPAVALTDPAGGLVILGSHLSPGTFYTFVMSDSLGTLIPLRAGQSYTAQAAPDGTLKALLSTRVLQPPGSYSVRITSGFPVSSALFTFTIPASSGTASTQAGGHQ